jgi:VIT1/CCC1 family predicted Fe2+/Mn2+ transporter
VFAALKYMVILQYTFTIVFLVFLGIVAGKAGGSNIVKGIIRICFWGTVAMGVTALAGYLFGVQNG